MDKIMTRTADETAASQSAIVPDLCEGTTDDAAAAAPRAVSRRVDEVIAATGIEVHPKKRKRLEKMSAAELKSYELRTLLTTACKDLNPTLAFKIYCGARASGTLPTMDVMNNVLSMLAGLGEPGSGCSRTRNPEGNLAAAVEIYEDAKKAKLYLRESSYAALIRCYCKLGDEDRALALYREVQATGQTLKHRALSPLLEVLAFKNKSELCFGLYHEMLHKYELIPLERDYASMLRLCLSTSDSRFIDILHQMMEDILIPKHKNSIEIIKEYFTSTRRFHCIEGARAELNGQLTSDGHDVSAHSLRSIDLTEEQRASLLKEITRAAENRIVHGRNGPASDVHVQSKSTGTYGDAEKVTGADMPPGLGKRKQDGSMAAWTDFVAYIEKRLQERAREVESRKDKDTSTSLSLSPVDVIVDGANVGYYKQNYAGAPSHIDYFQVDAMVRFLESTGRRPLIFLHTRHVRPGAVPSICAGLVSSWEQRGILYKAPAGCNDDWFWLYAAVAWRCQVITNDEMRDHHFRMLSPRWFNRWKERNQIHFSFDTGLAKDVKANLVANDRRMASIASASEEQSTSSVTATRTSINEASASVPTLPSSSAQQAVAPATASPASSVLSSGLQIGLRRRNIQLKVPLPYSCRMQHSSDATSPSYYIPVVKELLSGNEEEEEEKADQRDVDAGEDAEQGVRHATSASVCNNEHKTAKSVFRTVFREAAHPQAGSSGHASSESSSTTAGAAPASSSNGLGRHVSATTTFVAGTTDEPESVTWMCFLRK